MANFYTSQSKNNLLTWLPFSSFYEFLYMNSFIFVSLHTFNLYCLNHEEQINRLKPVNYMADLPSQASFQVVSSGQTISPSAGTY